MLIIPSLYRALRPALGLRGAATVKFLTGKVNAKQFKLLMTCTMCITAFQTLWGIGALWAVTYYAYYNSGDWYSSSNNHMIKLKNTHLHL